MKLDWTRAVCGALVALACVQGVALAQAYYLNEVWDTSIRAAGMGGTSAGVTWGDPNVWGNVATLASVEGVRWERGRTAHTWLRTDRVLYASDRVLMGHAGIGIGTEGLPAGLGAKRVSARTPGAAGMVEFQTTRIPSLQVAASLPRLWATLRGSNGPGAAYDVSFGMAVKRTTEQYNAVWPASRPPAYSRGTSWDVGLQGRWSPLRLGERRAQGADRVGFDVGAGAAVLDAFGSKIRWSMGGTESLTRCYRYGAATRLAVAMPTVSGNGILDRILAGLPHLVSVGLAYDHELQRYAPTGQTLGYRDLAGAELSIADVLLLRTGHVYDPSVTEGMTSGWGIGLPLGPWGGFRYDRARVPYLAVVDVPHLTRTGWTVWCDAMRLWRDFGHPGGTSHVTTQSIDAAGPKGIRSGEGS